MAQAFKTPTIPVANIKDIHPQTRMQDLMRQAYKLGPIFELPQPEGGRQLVVSGFSLVDEICSDTYYDKKVSPALRSLRSISGDGLFTADTSDPNWRKAHSILMPCFSMDAMRGYLPMMIDIAEQLVARWAHLNPDDEIDVGDDMSRLTLDTIGLCAFSYRFNSFARQDLHPFVKSMVNLLASRQEMLSLSPLERALHIRERRSLAEDRDLLLSTADRLIQDRKAEGEEGLKKHDLLNAMLTGVDRQTGEKLDDLNIRSQVITFLIAGHETTSGLLSFALFFLLHHPDVLARATAEVDQVLGADITKPPTFEQLHQLHYVSQILNESLRLAPPAPAFNRAPYQSRLLGGTYPVTPDDLITVLIPMLHRDHAIWGVDAEMFNPAVHFSPEAEKSRPTNAFKPFGTGQRSCIGRQFALQEATLALAMILRHFVIYSSRIYQLKIREALTIKPAYLFMKAKLRTKMDEILITPLDEPTAGAPATTQPTAGATKVAEAEAPVAIKTKTELLALYGSNAGTCEGLANRIMNDGNARGFTATSDMLDDYVDKLPKEGVVVIVTSSYNGTPPDNAVKFCQWLQSGLAKDALKGVNYTVFGCGSHDWAATYQAMPQLIDTLMEQAGATRVYPRGEGDVAGDFDGQFQAWYKPLWNGLARALSLDTAQIVEPKKAGPLYDVEIVRRPHPFPFVNSFGAAPLTVLANDELDRIDLIPDLKHSTRHIQLALPDDVNYRVGDHLGVIGSNQSAQVERVASHFHFDQQTIIQLHRNDGRKPAAPIEEPISVYDLLANYVELQDVAKREHLTMMAEYTKDAREKQHLEYLSGADAASMAAYQAEVLDRHASVIDILEDHPSCALPFQMYLECLTPLRPRYYSISSSPLIDPSECSITVSVVEGLAKSGHGDYVGVCSSYLEQKPAGSIIYAFVQNVSGPFHLPQNIQTPIIMVAAGTGLSPFRGFLQERLAQQKKGMQPGPSLLFFGCRHPQADFIYEAELESYTKAGLTSIYPAFSRLDSQKKQYVQHAILEQKDVVWQFLQNGAVVYVCGDASRMVPDVRASFIQLAQAKAGMDEQQATAWLNDLEKQQRYLVDIWGVTS